MTKKCTGPCQQERELKYYSKHSKSPDGLAYVCKFCATEKSKEHYRKQKEERGMVWGR